MFLLEGIIIDELKLYRGDDFVVKDGMVITQPTLNQICDYGEKDYYSMIYTLTSVPADSMWQLDMIGKDYTKIKDFELFVKWLYNQYDQEQTSIIFGDLNLKDFERCKKKDDGSIVLYNRKTNMIIDEYTYFVIVNILRKIHGLKRNDEMPGNESTRRILIEDARDAYLINKNKEFKSILKNMISTIINLENCNYTHESIWNMKIYPFIDAVKRSNQVKMADILRQSGYSGFGVDLKKLDNKQLDYFTELS